MKIISRRQHGAPVITDLDTGEKINISKMGLKELENLQYQVRLNEADFEFLQLMIIDARVGIAESRRDMEKEQMLKDIPSQEIVSGANKVIKTAQERGSMSQFNPNFDIKQAVKSDDDAALFVAGVIINDPLALPSCLGLSQDELYKTVINNIDKLLKNAPEDVVKSFKKTGPKDYIDMMDRLGKTILILGPPLSAIKQIIYPLLGFNPDTNDLLKRLYDYVPLAVKGTGDIEKMFTEENKGSIKKSIDGILDSYNEGKITKEQMDKMIREFGGYRPVLVKTASGFKIQWEKDVIKIAKTTDGKYKISRVTWENIGKTAGWLGTEMRKCDCGSGLFGVPEYDARGIFLTYACPKCKKDKLSKYRQDVLKNSQL